MADAPADSPLMFDLPPPAPDYALESGLQAEGLAPVAGVDEAGRGPLAGPVVAAAVILDPERIPDGLNDSKKLNAEQRQHLADQLILDATIGIGMASPKRIDATDIRQATLWAMGRAVAALHARPAFALIDGRDCPPGLACPAKAVIKGDGRALSIAAASIIAKVFRDHMMTRLAAHYTGYGFESHMGYGTKAHRAALAALGPSPIHRRSFAPIKSMVDGQHTGKTIGR